METSYKSILKKSRKTSPKRRSRKKSRKTSRRRRSRKKSRKTSRRRRSRKKSRKTSPKRRSRKKSRKTSRRRRSKKKVSFNFSSDIIDPTKSKTLTIYGMNGCPACEKSKQMCKNKDVKFNYYIRADHEETVKRIAPGYKYVPVVVDENGKFIGGSIELEKYLENY